MVTGVYTLLSFSNLHLAKTTLLVPDLMMPQIAHLYCYHIKFYVEMTWFCWVARLLSLGGFYLKFTWIHHVY